MAKVERADGRSPYAELHTLEGYQPPFDRRMAATLTHRARAAGRRSVFLSCAELRSVLDAVPAEAELVEIDPEAGRVVSVVRVVDLETRLGQLDGWSTCNAWQR